MSSELDKWGRRVRCLVCRNPLPRKRYGSAGRPRKYCARADRRCERIGAAAKKRTLCARCRAPLLFEQERLNSICNPCVGEVKRG